LKEGLREKWEEEEVVVRGRAEMRRERRRREGERERDMVGGWREGRKGKVSLSSF